MHSDPPQQILCPICMSIFKIPITIQCGHTFCKSCLVTSSKNSKNCPICRQQINFTPQKIKQDENLAKIILQFKKKMGEKKPSESINLSQPMEGKSESLMLVDIKTEDLMIPYNKILATFQMQSHSLLHRLDRFVARQESPFNKFGVISRIITLTELRHNIYQCILEGMAFCSIEEDWIEHEASHESDQQFFYRLCKAKQVCETSQLTSIDFNGFFKTLQKVDSDILNSIYKKVDSKIFTNVSETTPLYYGIIGILAISREQKYKAITSFDDKERLKQITRFTEKINSQKYFNASNYLSIAPKKFIFQKLIFTFITVVIVIFYLDIISFEDF